MFPIRQILADLVFPEGRDRRNQAEREANMDALTELPNYRALQLALPTAEEDGMTAFIMFDADNFGAFNKERGHQQGNDLIIQMANAIKSVCGNLVGIARAFRMGGDEFVVIVTCDLLDPEVYDEHLTFAAQVRNTIERIFGCVPLNPELVVSLTGGVGRDLEAADRACAERKKERKLGQRQGTH